MPSPRQIPHVVATIRFGVPVSACSNPVSSAGLKKPLREMARAPSPINPGNVASMPLPIILAIRPDRRHAARTDQCGKEVMFLARRLGHAGGARKHRNLLVVGRGGDLLELA